MKYKLLILTLFSFTTSILCAQNELISSQKLSWKELGKWYADSVSINVISFDGAQYPFANHLPYFNKKIVLDSAFSYQAKVLNPIYIPLTTEESDLLNGNNSVTTEVQILTNTLFERGNSILNVNVFPFIKRDGIILKLQYFDLQIVKSTHPQKADKLIDKHTYTDNSILTNGKFIKIKIANSGIYKFTYEDLASLGIDPTNVHIFGYGGNVLDQDFSLPKIDDLPELSIYMNKGADGIFNAGDYILFYAQGTVKWSYDKTKSMFVHTTNSYSKYGYYFISSDVGTGKRIEEKPITLPDSITANTVEEFTDYNVYEKDVVNLASSGKEFYQPFGDATLLSINMTFPNLVANYPLKATLDVATSSPNTSNFSLTLNGVQQKTLIVPARTSDNYTFGMAASDIYTFSASTDALAFSLNYSKPTSTSLAYLNYLEINARRQLKMDGSDMQFQNVDYLGQSSNNRYQLSNANSMVQIWDITDPQNISKIQTKTTNGKLTFVASSNELNNYLAIDPTASYSKPEIVGIVPNQNLHGILQADMIILTHPDFLAQAQKLAQAHREKDNLSVEVVTTDQVYNEFSSGTPDATAYRWIMKMLYDRALSLNNTANLPKYLLLFGRGTYDNRKLSTTSGDNNILTYQADNSLNTLTSYVTDDYFTFLDDSEGTNLSNSLMDISVGRLPVTTVQQATEVVTKTIGYMNNQNKGNWKNQICFLADDGGNGDGNIHMSQADDVAVSVSNLFPAYQINKIYLDAYLQVISASGESYPVAKDRFFNLLNSGLFLLDYTGHAGPTGWTNESILSQADVKELSNQHLPLFVAVTCDFSQFDTQAVSGGEQVVLNPIGGGIGILSATRPVFSSQNFVLNKLICNNLFKTKDGEHMRIGDVVAFAKNQINTGEINKLAYIYMGDPAVKLNYPTKYQVITSKINQDSNLGNDTLRALSVDTIQGYIADNNGKIATDFNGTLHIVIYDKVQQITTLNNHNEINGTFTYSDRPNILFSGKAVIKDGKYSFTFMLPKDIKYNYGGGRINYYAQDDNNDFEAQGYYENFIVGGTDKNYINESDGPTVKLYLNSENFVSGNKVDESPLFMANVSDIDGINTVGSGIGHDILLTIDQNPDSSYILNDYFQTNTNSYTDGTLNYRLPVMENGKHTLTFRVWDLLNNSTTQTIDFQVVKGLTPVIFTINNYPNPVTTQTRIIVKHDRPESILSTNVEIFDLSGRKIWSFSQSSADNIYWDLNTNNGQRVRAGIYLYRVSIKTKDSNVSSKTNKMLIKE